MKKNYWSLLMFEAREHARIYGERAQVRAFIPNRRRPGSTKWRYRLMCPSFCGCARSRRG